MSRTVPGLEFACLLVLAGCAGYRSPSVTVTEAMVVEETDEAIKLVFALEMANSNSVPLPLRYFEYTAEVDGRATFTGRRAAEATLPAGGSQTLSIPGVFLRSDLGETPALLSYAIHGRLYYETPGELAEVLLDTRLRRPKTRFSDEGTLRLDAAAPPAGR